MPTTMSAKGERWNVPDDDEYWSEGADKSSFPKESWTPTSGGIERQAHAFSKTTPATVASTPEHHSTAAPEDTSLPENYVTMISNAYGPHTDLYRDVLGVSRNASPRAVRIAYFRRGREVLSERPQGARQALPERTTTATISGGCINDLARLKFQAVSMAYEIISNPTWFGMYERIRLLQQQDDSDDDDDDYDDDGHILSDPSISSTRSLASTSALRRSSSTGSVRSRKSNAGVRWNEEVEELVFNQDPEEHRNNSRLEKKKTKKDKKKKKSKKRITLDTDNLEKHLEQLDKEAEKNFAHDFFDDLEQSIDQFFNFSGGEEAPADSSTDEEDEEVGDITARPLFPKETPAPMELSPERKLETKIEPPNAPRKRLPHKEELDIDDDEFEMYQKHHQRNSKTTPSMNPFDEEVPVGEPPKSDARQEVAGSQPFEITPREGSMEDDEGSYVSFCDHKDISDIRQTQSWGDVKPIARTPLPKYSPIRFGFGSIGGEPSRPKRSLDRYAPRIPNPDDSSRIQEPLSPSRSVSSEGHRTPPRTRAGSGSQKAPISPKSPNRVGVQTHARLDPWVGASRDDEDELMFASPDGEHARFSDLPQEESPKATPVVLNDPALPRSPGRRNKNAVQTRRKSLFAGPENIEVTRNYEMTFDDGDSAIHTVADTVSTLSASVVQRHVNRDLTNSRYRGNRSLDKHQYMELVKEEDGINSLCDAIAPNARKTRQTKPFSDKNHALSSKGGSEVDPGGMMICFQFCGDEDDLPHTARMSAAGESESDFTTFFITYLNALANDLAKLGHSIQEKWESFGIMQSVEISEKDLQGMLRILESEMEEVPDDIAKTLSQEFMPGNE